jgi:hypothetical protein
MSTPITLLPPAPPKPAAINKPDTVVVEPPKPELKIIETSPGAPTHYAGQPAYVGADVWYISANSHTGELVPKIAKLFERSETAPDRWTLTICSHGRTWDPMQNVEFAEAPKVCCWTWPVKPEATKEAPKDKAK